MRSGTAYREASAILSFNKIFSTLVAKDVEEIGAIHVRSKTGMGMSINFDRILPFPVVAELLSRAHVNAPDDYTPR